MATMIDPRSIRHKGKFTTLAAVDGQMDAAPMKRLQITQGQRNGQRGVSNVSLDSVDEIEPIRGFVD